MLFGQLSCGRADAPSYRDKEAPRGHRDQSKTTWKDMVYVILELSLRRNKGQPADTVMRSVSLLRTPKDLLRTLTDMHERHLRVLISSWKSHKSSLASYLPGVGQLGRRAELDRP